MPFGPAWSVEVYQSITECAHMVDPTMIVVRADKLNTPGRITLQVEKEIGVADFVIADVTDNNPNVLWELGFAHALERPSVILSQDIGQAPFDFRDFRMIQYTNPLDPNARQQLMAHIRNSIEIVESNSKMGKTPGELWRG
jgi:nucleoside 2-deoxyribosyltransferase